MASAVAMKRILTHQEFCWHLQARGVLERGHIRCLGSDRCLSKTRYSINRARLANRLRDFPPPPAETAPPVADNWKDT